MGASDAQDAIGKKTGFLVWSLIPLVPLGILAFALQPAPSLIASPWLRSLHVQMDEVTPALRAVVFAGFVAAYSPVIWALMKLGRLARAYASGRVFVDEAAQALASASWALILLPIILIAGTMLVHIALAELALVASGRIALSVQLEWFLICAIGLVLRLVARAMKRAVVIAREHSEYV